MDKLAFGSDVSPYLKSCHVRTYMFTETTFKPLYL